MGKRLSGARLRDDLETALRSSFVDRADGGGPTPGARERAILRQGTRPETPVGEAVRFIAQFKAFPVTMLSRVLGRASGANTTRQFFQNMLTGKGDVLGIAHMIVAMTALGYGSLGMDACSSGRRTFVTKAARKIVEAGGSLRDVQQLAGHRSLQTTQGYIDENPQAKRRVVEMI